jgi:zinc transport system permease protein
MQLLSDPFFQMALFASLLASIAGGMMGSFVVVKRIVFIAGSIAHSVLAGMGVCLWLMKTQSIAWLTPLHGAVLAAVASALTLGYIHLNYRQREDSIIAAIWSTGMAVGIIFLSMTPGNTAEMMNFLFGNILWIGMKDLWLLAGLDLLILGALLFKYRAFLSICFDEELSLLQKVKVQRLYLILLTLIAITVVLLMQIVGTVLVIAMLTVPAMTAALFTRSLGSMILLSIGLSSLFSFSGLSFAYVFDWPPGATIALVSAVVYLFSMIGKRTFATVVAK